MSEHYLRQQQRVYNYQDTTPKRTYQQQQTSFTQPYLNHSPIYLTPDRIMKQPYRNVNQSYNDMSDMSKRITQQQQYPPTYQSSQISIQQELNNTSKIMDQHIRKSENSIQESSWFQVKNTNISPNMQRMDKQIKQREYPSPFNEHNQQITDRNFKPQFEDKVLGSKSDLEKIKQILIDTQLKLNLQLDEYKSKLNKQDQKIREQDQKYKDIEKQNIQLRQQLNDKQQEIKNIQQTYLSQQKMQDLQEQQTKKFHKIYDQLAKQNDDLREENNQLKMLLLQVDNYSSVSRSILSKKNSEQEFQIISHSDNIKEMIENFIQGYSEDLLTLSQDNIIQSVFISFRDIINSIKQNQNFDFQMIKSGDFMKIKRQSEDIVTVPDLHKKAESIIRDIKQKMEQIAKLKEGDPLIHKLKDDIDKLQKEYDGIQILVTEQSDYLDKNLHRNSIISFDQNFDGEEHQ